MPAAPPPFKRALSTFFILFISCPNVLFADDSKAKNVILFIGDGMGQAHVLAARVFAHGPAGRLNMECLEHFGYVTTYPNGSFVTDSAAAGTAMATGHKTSNNIIGRGRYGQEYKNVLELAREMGKATGLVTTTEVTHATPAAFAAHEAHRAEAKAIALDYLDGVQPDVILGGGAWVWTPDLLEEARKRDYTIVFTKKEMDTLDSTKSKRLLGLFAHSHMAFATEQGREEPSLKEMTLKALEILRRDPDGFFLMVEGGRIDNAGHNNDLRRLIHEVLGFDEAIGAVMAGLGDPNDTLFIITADHETGGLAIVGPGGHLPGKGEMVEVRWATKRHTAADVPIWAQGPGAEAVRGKMDNTVVFSLIKEALGVASAPGGLPIKIGRE
ncbi:MAG: alkaline phosphatase [Candidatus Brocadiaceae bacterium]|nr:alkaline phosphatase [Candidatus Brocadiaceae bacterium]